MPQPISSTLAGAGGSRECTNGRSGPSQRSPVATAGSSLTRTRAAGRTCPRLQGRCNLVMIAAIPVPSRVIANAVIAGFRVQSLIGAGSMGSVYLAEDTRTGESVALKVMTQGLAGDERFRQRFERESALAATLDHPHIVRTLASGEADGLLFLAMAFVEGSDLRDVLQGEGRLEPDRALRLIAQTAQALDAAHAAGPGPP